MRNTRVMLHLKTAKRKKNDFEHSLWTEYVSLNKDTKKKKLNYIQV